MKEVIESNGGILGFHPSGVQAWKAYNIGFGELFPCNDVQRDSSFPCSLEALESPVQTQRSCFRVIRSRQDQVSTGSKCVSSSCQHTEAIADEEVMAQESEIFSCPEESCIKTFQRSSALQAHLNEGRHKHALEKETLLHKAKRGYVAKITGEITQVPTVVFRPAASHGAVAENSQEENRIFTVTKELPY
ncbi:hypothetical protein AWC38_SpisGene24115 [Stylophora pistillata]|uniref:C2H2-type domain-containing protein n=1 Tax=Stylophora pistillata TaxID=50429 RepID=A0A2B4R6K4_STYPI|nr:hypothetical protein AWC38_SpisGene24115 [Stylophora pistillata]